MVKETRSLSACSKRISATGRCEYGAATRWCGRSLKPVDRPGLLECIARRAGSTFTACVRSVGPNKIFLRCIIKCQGYRPARSCKVLGTVSSDEISMGKLLERLYQARIPAQKKYDATIPIAFVHEQPLKIAGLTSSTPET